MIKLIKKNEMNNVSGGIITLSPYEDDKKYCKINMEKKAEV